MEIKGARIGFFSYKAFWVYRVLPRWLSMVFYSVARCISQILKAVDCLLLESTVGKRENIVSPMNKV